MNELRFKGSLLSGSNYITNHGIEIINYNLGYIYGTIELDEYYGTLQIINFDKKTWIDKGYDETEVDYSILCGTIYLLEKFVKCKEVNYHSEFGRYMVYISDTEFIWVDTDMLKSIFDMIKKMYCIPEPDTSKDEIIFDNDEVAQKFAEFFEAEKDMKDDIVDGVTMGSMIEYVSNKSPSLNIINIWNLTMWQLHRNYVRLQMIDNYDNTMRGIYAGTIDSKKINIEKIRADKVIL